MEPDDLVITDLRGRKLAGRREASSELADAQLCSTIAGPM